MAHVCAAAESGMTPSAMDPRMTRMRRNIVASVPDFDLERRGDPGAGQESETQDGAVEVTLDRPKADLEMRRVGAGVAVLHVRDDAPLPLALHDGPGRVHDLPPDPSVPVGFGGERVVRVERVARNREPVAVALLDMLLLGREPFIADDGAVGHDHQAGLSAREAALEGRPLVEAPREEIQIAHVGGACRRRRTDRRPLFGARRELQTPKIGEPDGMERDAVERRAQQDNRMIPPQRAEAAQKIHRDRRSSGFTRSASASRPRLICTMALPRKVSLYSVTSISSRWKSVQCDLNWLRPRSRSTSWIPSRQASSITS